MQFCKVTVRHNGDMGFEVPNKVVSVPEIQVLRFLHGLDSVNSITLCEPPLRRDHEGNDVPGFDVYEHVDYLRQTYSEKAVTACFGEVIHRLPETLREIGIDPETEARAKRDAATRLLAEAEALEGKTEVVAAGQAAPGGESVAEGGAKSLF